AVRAGRGRGRGTPADARARSQRQRRDPQHLRLLPARAHRRRARRCARPRGARAGGGLGAQRRSRGAGHQVGEAGPRHGRVDRDRPSGVSVRSRAGPDTHGRMIDLPSIAGDPLLRQLMFSGRVADADLERVLTLARRELLAWARGVDPPGAQVQEFFAALAQQCFLTEYVFWETDEEHAEVERLTAALGERLAAGTDVPLALLLAVAA